MLRTAWEKFMTPHDAKMTHHVEQDEYLGWKVISTRTHALNDDGLVEVGFLLSTSHTRLARCAAAT